MGMKLILSEKFATKEPEIKVLKKNRTTLTDEERKQVMDRGATWHHGPNGEATHAVWKSEVNGKIWYVCNTHRAYQCKSTLKGAIKSYDFIETTASGISPIKVILSENARKKMVDLKGTLKKAPDNFVYLNIPNNVINGLVLMLDYEGVEKPPYDLKSFNRVGAHISVIGTREYEDHNLGEIKEIGQEFNFHFKGFKRVNPEGWDGMQQVYFMEVESPEIEKLRKSYGLSKLIDGHQFHITVGVKKS